MRILLLLIFAFGTSGCVTYEGWEYTKKEFTSGDYRVFPLDLDGVPYWVEKPRTVVETE